MDRNIIPQGAKVLPSTWVFKIKRYPDGRLRKFKARFCVRGDLQEQGVDYFESYAPVIPWSSVILMLVLAAHLDLCTRQIYFSNAFSQATLQEEVYIKFPATFQDSNSSGNVLKLNKSLYGLVQAPLAWYQHLVAKLMELNWKASEQCTQTSTMSSVSFYLKYPFRSH